MKFAKEVRIGALVVITILVFFSGYYFLRGAKIFSGEYQYYAYYDDVQGLVESSPVQIKGMSVGRVSKILLTNGTDKVKVTLAVGKKTRLPKGTVAKLVATDLLGTKAISLDLGDKPGLVDDKAVLPSEIESGIVDAISVEITPLLQDMRHAVSTLDSALVTINEVLDVESRDNLKNSISNLDVAASNFSQLSERLNAESGQLASLIRNTNSITTNLVNNNERITRIITNAEITSKQLSQAPIEKTVRDLNETIDQLQLVVNKISSKDGSLGLLINDKGLYHNLNSSLNTLNSLMADIEAHPARYINFSIFNRNNK